MAVYRTRYDEQGNRRAGIERYDCPGWMAGETAGNTVIRWAWEDRHREDVEASWDARLQEIRQQVGRWWFEDPWVQDARELYDSVRKDACTQE